ncbi:hypothetical protein ACQUSY_08480 [Microbacterium sp. YY-03]|uniref:AbiTii domain-containing protein n=1 Tax=Microbacterium sp. YY-03 TaxID=3421636 RepID=UPI003D1687B8
MDRQGEALRISEEFLGDIELARLKASEIVLKASRLARLVGRDDLTEFLTYERGGYPKGSDAAKWIDRSGRWAAKDENKYYPQSIAKVEASLQAAETAIEAMRGGGNYSGDMILPASRDHDSRIAGQAQAAGIWLGISGQVVAVIYDLVAEIYHELLFSELQASLFADIQSVIDGTLAEASGTALAKIERVSERLRDGDPESVSQALTTCRRLIDSCTDSVFPARTEQYPISDDVALSVGQQNVLNRLQAHIHTLGVAQGRRDRLRRTLADLYSRCSAGTHADVSVNEARYIFIQVYIALGEILSLSHDPRKPQ